MARHLAASGIYAGRTPDKRVTTVDLDRSAFEIIAANASKKNYGAFISRLCFEFAARMEERQRVLAEVATASAKD